MTSSSSSVIATRTFIMKRSTCLAAGRCLRSLSILRGHYQNGSATGWLSPAMVTWPCMTSSSALHFGGRAVDLIGEQEVGKDRSNEVLKSPVF